MIAVGRSEKIDCDGKYGGSYQWKGHDFTIMLPPGCADKTVAITLEAYLPSSTQEHCLLSAVFDVTTNVETFKKPVTVHIPHCANIRSEEDKERLYFLILHKDFHEFIKGYFEIGGSFGSIELTKFSKVTIIDYLLSPISSCLAPLSSFFTSDSPAVIERHTSGANVKKINKKYLDLLILPKSHNDISNKWCGKYCVIQDNSTYRQVRKIYHAAMSM